MSSHPDDVSRRNTTLLRIEGSAIEPTHLEETSHYHVTRGILENPERYWKHLRGAGEAE